MDSEYLCDTEASDTKLCELLGDYLLLCRVGYVPLAGYLGSTDSQTQAQTAQPETGTCVDELHMSLQVSVDHEYLVAARVWAGPFPDLLMVLLDVLLGKKRHENLVFHLNTSCLPGDPA